MNALLINRAKDWLETDDRRIQHLLLIAISGVFAALVCLVPPSLTETIDYIAFYRPNFYFFREAIADGCLPLWNPYIGLGRPFLADLQSAVFYPPGYFLLIGGITGIFLLVWSHLWLAAWGMQILSRVLQIGKPQSYFVVVCFLGSGILMGRWFSGQLLYACGLCYIPLLFANAAQMGADWNFSRLAAQALFMALQLLSGHPQVFWFSTLALGVFVLAQNIRTPWIEGARELVRGIAQISLATLWSLGIAAIVLLPFFELVQQGNRTAPSEEFSNFGRMEWAFFQSLFKNTVNGAAVPWEVNIFVGLFVVVLGFAGLCRVREKNVRGLLGVLVFALLISLAGHSPFFNLFREWLPAYASLRVHARVAMLLSFVLICGAGIWLSRPHPRLRSLIAANFDVTPRTLLIVLVTFQCLLLLHSAWFAKRAYHPSDYFVHAPDSPVQQMVAARLQEMNLLRKNQPPPRVSIPGYRSTSNNAMVRHYGNFDAYTSLFLRRPWVHLHLIAGLEPPRLTNTCLLPKVYERSAFPYTNLNLVAGMEPGTGALLVATNPSPRAFVVHAMRQVKDSDAATQALLKGHDMHAAALLESPLAISLPETSAAARSKPVSFIHFDSNSIVMDVEAAEDGLLIVAEAWYPGWKATVDGKYAAVAPANAWMQSVPIIKGRHRVKMSFHQNHLFAGAAFSLVGVALLAITLAKRRSNS